jgi:hypothetical protein
MRRFAFPGIAKLPFGIASGTDSTGREPVEGLAPQKANSYHLRTCEV